MMTTEERVAILATAAAELVQDGMTIGLGSGSTSEAVVRALGRRVAGGMRLTAVATSGRTAALAREIGIGLVDLDEVDALDLGIDGADEIDPQLNLVKGRGGALLWEKLVAALCAEWVIVSTSEKLVEQLGTRMPLPVEVIPFGWRHTARRIESLGCKTGLRMTGEGEQPFVTDGGHYILDCTTGPILHPISFGVALKETVGVVDHGLFFDLASSAMIVDQLGNVSTIRGETGAE